MGFGGLESRARCAGFSVTEIARSACAFAKRARLPQAEDSAPMRVSRIDSPTQPILQMRPRARNAFLLGNSHKPEKKGVGFPNPLPSVTQTYLATFA